MFMAVKYCTKNWPKNTVLILILYINTYYTVCSVFKNLAVRYCENTESTRTRAWQMLTPNKVNRMKNRCLHSLTKLLIGRS